MGQPVQPLSYAMNDLGFSSWQKQETFSSPSCLDWLWSQPASYSMGTESPLLGLKRLGHEADRSPQTTAEIKNKGSYTSTSPIRHAQRQFYLFSDSSYKLYIHKTVAAKLHMSDCWHSHCSYEGTDVAKHSINCQQYYNITSQNYKEWHEHTKPTHSGVLCGMVLHNVAHGY
jgi:hypothetical protein